MIRIKITSNPSGHHSRACLHSLLLFSEAETRIVRRGDGRPSMGTRQVVRLCTLHGGPKALETITLPLSSHCMWILRAICFFTNPRPLRPFLPALSPQATSCCIDQCFIRSRSQCRGHFLLLPLLLRVTNLNIRIPITTFAALLCKNTGSLR